MSPVGEAVELLGYLCEEEDGVARRVGQQRLVAVDHECGDGSGEQPRLRCEMVQEVVGQRLVHKQRDDEAKKKKSAAYKDEYPFCARFPCFDLILVAFFRMR